MALSKTTLEKSSKATTNPFLEDNYAPVKEECVFTDLSVKGVIPEELSGYFVRIGPNPEAAVNPKNYHWFMGTGMVHGLRLQNGRAQWYRNNFVLTDKAAANLKRTPLPTPQKKSGGAVNTNVLRIGDEIFALVEAGSLPVKLDTELRSVEHSNFNGSLKGGFSAHPRLDPKTGELHVLTYEPGKFKINYLIVDKSGSARQAAMIDAPHSPMVHDTAITESSVIFLDLPVTFDLPTALMGKFPYVWRRKQQPRIGLLPRDGNGPIVYYEAPVCAVYHIMNAFDTGSKTMIDVVKNSLNFDIDIHKRHNTPLQLVRWTIDRSSGKLTEEQLSDYQVEFPRINEQYTGREYRFGYTAKMTEQLELGPAYKHDLKTGKTLVHDFGPGRATMEPVFVPKKGSLGEDEGWVMSYVFDQNSNTSEIVILDAQNFEENTPVASIKLPVRVPFGFHGNWIADK